MGSQAITFSTIALILWAAVLVSSRPPGCTEEHIKEVDECAKRAFVMGNRNFTPPQNDAELDVFCE